MDLSEMTRLEKSEALSVKPGEMVSINTTKLTEQAMNELMSELSKAVSDAMFKPLATVTRVAERELLLLKLADALEAETDHVHCKQVFGTEHMRTVNLGTFYMPVMPSVIEHSVGDVVGEAETIKVECHERLVHYVCALGKIGVVLSNGNPRGWRSLGLPQDVMDLIIKLNDKQRLSFAQIATALRSRAAGLT